MKTITVRQPWASLITCGAKLYENRSWKTSYRGPLLIHAAQSIDCTRADWQDELSDPDGPALFPGLPSYDDLVKDRSVIVCRVELVDCLHIDEILDALPDDVEPHWSAGGPWAWLLANPVPVRSPVTKGKLGFWNYDGPLLTEAIA